MEHGLIQRAREALRGTKRPKDVVLRRAVSDAYYAVFHALCRMCADHFVGARHRNTEPWRRIYRGLNHKSAKAALGNEKVRGRKAAYREIGIAFVDLQINRHRADYDPQPAYRRRAEIEPIIKMAEDAIREIDGLNAADARELAALILFNERS